ncbi:2045_t:CDS:2 [Entrophospora sp. SA101]|nr:2045_t:CDS:2 [Entrophospora sp. SA101]
MWLERRPSSFNYGSANNMNGTTFQPLQQIIQQPTFQPPQQIIQHPTFQQPTFQPPQQIVQQPAFQPPQQIVQPPPQIVQKTPLVYDYQRNFCPKTEKAKYYEELRNYADMGLEAEDNRVLEPMEIDYAIVNIAGKLNQPERLPNPPNSSVNLVRDPRVSTRLIQRKCEICKKLGHTYRSCPIIKNMMVNNSKKKIGRVNFADGFQQGSDTEENPDEAVISDQEEDNISDGDSNVDNKGNRGSKASSLQRTSLQGSQNPTSTLLERRIREIIQSELENSALFEETIHTEDEEVVEDMEINFVQDKDVIDVPTVRGKIKRLVLSAIVDPGSNTLLMSRDIADRLGLKIDKSVTFYFKGASTVLTKSIGMVYNVPLTLVRGCVFYLDFVVIEYDKPMLLLSNAFLEKHGCVMDWPKSEMKLHCNGKDFIIPVTMHKVKNKLEVHHVNAIPSISEDTDSTLKKKCVDCERT